MSDDFGGTPATAGLLTVGVALQGSFEVGYDVDLFKVSLSAGTTYLLGLSQLNMPYLGVRYSPMALLLKSDDGTLLDLLSMPETFQLSADTLLPVLQFTPAANGDYYLMARSDTAATGSYVLGASIQPPDDFRSDIATTGTLTPGAASHAVFEFAGDHDWFKFHAELGQHYNFSYSMAQPDSVAPSQFRLYDSAGKALPYSIYAFEPLTSGDYFLSAEGLQTGAYVVTEKLLQDDYSSNGSSPGQLTLNGSSSGALTYQGDQDRFLFAAAAGVTYAIELAGDPQDQPFLSFACYDSNGQYVQLATYTTASGALHASLTSTTATTYHILVSGRGYTGGLITHAPYSLSATGPSADDYGDTAATAAALSIGTTVHGALQSSRDVDMFQTQLQAGTTYRFVLEPDDGRVPGIATRQLQISDADGQPLPGSFSAVPGQLEFTPSASGKVLISASASGLANTAAGYTLLSGLAADDVGANAAHAGVLPIGAKASGNLENGADRDWFAVNLTAGSTYWFQLEGVADNGGTLPQRATLRLVDAQGMEYASVHEIGTAAQQPLAFAPAVSGSYYVEVVYPGATGTYQLSAQIGLQDDYADDRAHATLLSLDSGITGSLELPNDKDLFQLMVTAGTTYNLRLDRASDHGYWQGPRPQLSDASGQPIALSSKLSGDTNFSFTAPSNGPVYVTVGIGVTNSNNIGPYYLQASSLGVDDFPANSSTTAVLLPNGKLQGTLNTTSDSDWIKVHLEAGQDYHFDLLGSANGGGTLNVSNSTVSLVLLPGESLPPPVTSASPGPNLQARVTMTGDYYLEVTNKAQPLAETGSYTVALSSATDDQRDPQLLGSSIGFGAVGVPTSSSVVLTYSEPVTLGWGGWTLVERDPSFPASTQLNAARVQVGLGALSNTVNIDLNGLLQPGKSYQLSQYYAAVQDLAGNPSQSGTGVIFSTRFVAPPALTQIGTAGNDVLKGSGNGSTLSGGEGVDLAVYDFGSANYVVTRNTNQLTVQLKDAALADLLSSVERLTFSDAHLALDINGHGGQAYRMYQAAFDRTPDAGGVGYWMALLDQGATLHDVASSFVTSAEFIGKYGSAPSDAQFVDLLYQNVLHRGGDTAGVNYWLQALHNGMSRAEGLINFSESGENQSGVLPLIANGFPYTPWHA